MNEKTGLLWLHNDLRLHDSPSLQKASKYCDHLLVFYATYDFPVSRGQCYYFHDISSQRKRFLHETISDLQTGLQQLGNDLLFMDKASLKQLVRFIEHYDITDVFYSQTSDYNHNLRHRIIAQRLSYLRWHESATATLFADLPMLNLPKSFIPFRQHIEKNSYLLRQKVDLADTPIPYRLPTLPKAIDKSLFYFSEHFFKKGENFTGGETQALLHLKNYFASDAPSTYKTTRNSLDEWTHSTKFSAWLANGSLSVRSLLNVLRQYEKKVIANDSTYWIWFELLWREYFHWYADTHQKKLFLFKGTTSCKSMSCFYGERFERWKNGNTPYPIINACMNQLRATGYLSNRGRQLTANCFIHELGMDWRYGATYFEQQLIDYDVASNWGNWQYISRVGADPHGGRKFNLYQQTQTYDPEGTFIKRWQGQGNCRSIDSVDAADWPI